MEFLVSLFVGKPLNILAMAALFFVGYLVLKITMLGFGRYPRWLLYTCIAWGLYAAWEWLIQILTPEANIRVDLLLIWPILSVFSAWTLFRTFR